MKTTLQSLHFPVPLILIPKEKDRHALSELNIEETIIDSTGNKKVNLMFGYQYVHDTVKYEMPNKLSLTKFTIAFWYSKLPADTYNFITRIYNGSVSSINIIELEHYIGSNLKYEYIQF